MNDIAIPPDLGEGDTFVHEGLRFTVMNGELTVRDLDLGEYVYEELVSRSNTKAYKARALTRRHLAELERVGTVYSVSEPYLSGKGRSQDATVFYLTEAPLYHLTARTRTSKGSELRISMTQVFFAWRKGRLVSPKEATNLMLEAPRGVAAAASPMAYDIDRTTSYKGAILSEFGHAMHVLDGSLAMALGMTIEQLDAHLATRPFIEALGERPTAPGGAGRFMNLNHVDFAVDGLPPTDKLLTIRQVMIARDKGDVSIVHGKLVWAYKTESDDDASRKLLEMLLRRSDTAPWNAIDMMLDAEGAVRARHTHLALYLGAREATVREAIADNRDVLEQAEAIVDRIENLHGNSVVGHYMTVDQCCTLAEIVGKPAKSGEEAFETYFACEKKVEAAVDRLEAKRDALQRQRDEEDRQDGNPRPPLPKLRSRVMRRLTGRKG